MFPSLLWLSSIPLCMYTTGSIMLKDIGLEFFWWGGEGNLVWFWYRGTTGFVKWVWKLYLEFCGRVGGQLLNLIQLCLKLVLIGMYMLLFCCFLDVFVVILFLIISLFTYGLMNLFSVMFRLFLCVCVCLLCFLLFAYCEVFI